jgi:hypothetical protein
MKKEFKPRLMEEFLKRGLRKAKKTSPPSDGYMFNLITNTTRGKWTYWVDFVSDERVLPKPFVSVHAVPKGQCGGFATHSVRKEI